MSYFGRGFQERWLNVVTQVTVDCNQRIDDGAQFTQYVELRLMQDLGSKEVIEVIT